MVSNGDPSVDGVEVRKRAGVIVAVREEEALITKTEIRKRCQRSVQAGSCGGLAQFSSRAFCITSSRTSSAIWRRTVSGT